MATEGDRARALLTYANYAKVASALQVSRTAVAEWAKGQSVTPYRLRQLEQLLRPDLQIEEAPPPTWARELEDRLGAKLDGNRQLIERLIPDEALRNADDLIERLEELLRLRGEDPPEESGGSVPGEAETQVQADGSPPVRSHER